ncbi:uncharacterized protein [Apostichopus japonicus]|uniref:uncharacterized protein n=1 Tax=Stichopus japonicus TaxID=307972 RepID=UPI003AB76B81
MAAYSLRHYKIILIVSITIYFMIKISPGDSIDISIDSKPGDKVIFNCTANEAALKEWKYEGHLIFHNQERFAQELNNTIYAEEEFQKLMNNSVHVDENNSLIINPVSTGHAGIYTCWLDEKKKEKVLLQIKVPPDVSLSINGKEYKTELVWLAKGNNFTITCRALNSIPAANITWSRQALSSDQTSEKDCIVNDNGNTDTTSLDERFNSTSTIYYQPEQDETLVCCAWFGAEVVGKFILKISTYELVLQPVEVEVNGIAAMDKIPRKTMAMVTCAANITKLPFHDNLAWRVNSTSDFHSERNFTDTDAHLGSPTRFSVAVYSVTYSPQEVREFIECTVTDKTFATTATIWRSFQTFDFVDVTLSINEMEDNRSIYIIREQGTYYVMCSFLLQNVPINITWKVIHTTFPMVTFEESSSILIFSPTKGTGSVACVLEGPYNQLYYQIISFEVSDTKPETGSSRNDIYIILAAIFILAVFIFALWEQNTACQCNNVTRNKSSTNRSKDQRI